MNLITLICLTSIMLLGFSCSTTLPERNIAQANKYPATATRYIPYFPVCSACGQTKDGPGALACPECTESLEINPKVPCGGMSAKCQRITSSCEQRQNHCDQMGARIKQCFPKDKDQGILPIMQDPIFGFKAAAQKGKSYYPFDAVMLAACVAQRELGCDCREEHLKVISKNGKYEGPFQFGKELWNNCLGRGLISKACADKGRSDLCCAAQCFVAQAQDTETTNNNLGHWPNTAKACLYPGNVKKK